jgi:hypothetical protein
MGFESDLDFGCKVGTGATDPTIADGFELDLEFGCKVDFKLDGAIDSSDSIFSSSSSS